MLVYSFIFIYIEACVQHFGLMGTHDRYDINAQCANVTGSLKLRNINLPVVGHYFCCTIPWAVYCGRAIRELNVLHCSSYYVCICLCIDVYPTHTYFGPGGSLKRALHKLKIIIIGLNHVFF